jgi:DNA-binding MarR family transcriptional regulator
MPANDPAQAMGIDTAQERALIALVRAAWAASAPSNAVVRKAGLSPSQYNVLRILRCAGGGGLRRNGISDRMVTRDPDLTRILSGLTRMGAVTSRRAPADRRSRVSTITEHGRTLLAGLDHEVREAAIASLSGLSRAQLKKLEALLEAVGRGPAGRGPSWRTRADHADTPSSRGGNRMETGHGKQDHHGDRRNRIPGRRPRTGDPGRSAQ